MKKLLKLPLKLLALPLIPLFSLGHLLMTVLNNLASYVTGIPLLFILGCGIYSLVQLEWTNFWILTVLEIGCLALLFASVWLETTLGSIAKSLTAFLHS